MAAGSGSCGCWLLLQAKGHSQPGFLTCSLSLWESPQLVMWQRGRLLGVGCFCFSFCAFPHFFLKQCHQTLCTTSLFSQAGLGLICKMEHLIHVARPHLSLQGSWPETGELIPIKGTGTPCFYCCHCPVTMTKCLRGRGVHPVSHKEFLLLALGHLSGALFHQSFSLLHLSSSFALYWLLPFCLQITLSLSIPVSRKQGSQWDWEEAGDSQKLIGWQY